MALPTQNPDEAAVERMEIDIGNPNCEQPKTVQKHEGYDNAPEKPPVSVNAPAKEPITQR